MLMETNAITPKKIAIVTGGSRGIGRNTVESLARRGVNTIFTYHTHGTDAEAVVAAVKDAGAEAVDFTKMTSAQKVAYHKARWDRILG